MPRIPILIALAILAVTAAGCGSKPATPGVAQVATTTTTTTTTTTSSESGDSPSGSSKEDNIVQYSVCMRANGVPGFPDPKPESGGGMSLSFGPGVDPESPQFQAAEKACEKLLPGGKAGGGKAMDAKARTQMLQFSACMRSHGVPDFPDPTFSRGGARLGLSKKGSLNPRSPVFQAAQKACEKNLPDGPKRSVGPAGASAGGKSDAP